MAGTIGGPRGDFQPGPQPVGRAPAERPERVGPAGAVGCEEGGLGGFLSPARWGKKKAATGTAGKGSKSANLARRGFAVCFISAGSRGSPPNLAPPPPVGQVLEAIRDCRTSRFSRERLTARKPASRAARAGRPRHQGRVLARTFFPVLGGLNCRANRRETGARHRPSSGLRTDRLCGRGQPDPSSAGVLRL